MSAAGTITPVDYRHFGRVGRVEIWENGAKCDRFNLDGLDFEFETSNIFMYQPGSSPLTATVKILGLQQGSVDWLCQFVSEATFFKRNLSVRVLAGYETSERGAQEIFNLPIVRAIPSAMPDNWLTLTANVSFTSKTLVSFRTSGKDVDKDGVVSAYDAMMELAEQFGIVWQWEDGAEEAAKKAAYEAVTVNGGVDNAVDALRDKCSALRIVQLPSVAGNGQAVYYAVYPKTEDKNDDTSGRNVWTVNSAYGMIGVPSWVGNADDQRRIRVRTLLNPAYRPRDVVKLTSVIAKDLSRDDYRVLTVSHRGHLRGNEWYSDLELMSGIK